MILLAGLDVRFAVRDGHGTASTLPDHNRGKGGLPRDYMVKNSETVSLVMDSPAAVRSRSPRSDCDDGEPSDEQWIDNPLLSKRNQ